MGRAGEEDARGSERPLYRRSSSSGGLGAQGPRGSARARQRRQRRQRGLQDLPRHGLTFENGSKTTTRPWVRARPRAPNTHEAWCPRAPRFRTQVGVVTNTWEKCTEDPICCCAELSDENLAVTVDFAGEFSYYLGADTPRYYFKQRTASIFARARFCVGLRPQGARARKVWLGEGEKRNTSPLLLSPRSHAASPDICSLSRQKARVPLALACPPTCFPPRKEVNTRTIE